MVSKSVPKDRDKVAELLSDHVLKKIENQEETTAGSMTSQEVVPDQCDSDDGAVVSNVAEIEKTVASTTAYKWDPAEWECVRTIQDAVRNYGRVDKMKCRTRQWGHVAVKRMPTKWVRYGPAEFTATYPQSSEKPWFDIGILRYLNMKRFPYVCKLYGVFQDPECSCVVMSIADPGDLFSWCDQLAAQGAKREAAVKPVARQMLSAVTWLHNLGISHRDLSLENILLNQEAGGGPQVKLIDFGMSTLSRRAMNEVRGKQSYQAPEMHLETSHDTFLTDTFALGVVLFCLVCQDYPWMSTVTGQCQLFQFIGLRGLRAFFDKRKLRKGNGMKLGDVLSEPLKELLEGMLDFEPSNRLTLGECCWSGATGEARHTVWDVAWFDDWADSDAEAEK